MATGQLARPGGPLDTLAEEHGASPSQLALAWLLHRSPVMLPIPGISRVTHVEENTEAAQVTLNDTEHQALSRAVWPAHTPGGERRTDTDVCSTRTSEELALEKDDRASSDSPRKSA